MSPRGDHMQTRIKEYLWDVSRKRGKSLSICLLGYGTTNRAILDIISNLGCQREITVRQNREISDTPLGVKVIDHKIAFCDIYEDVVFTSPSFRRDKVCLPAETILTSDIEIFFGKRQDNTFLVSGSDGKSTVTTLTSLLLCPTFPELFAGGNLGRPIATASLSADAFVIELSSFNLMYTAPKSKRAILTNVTPNHLDWHKDLAEYEACKSKLIYLTDEAVLPLSCPFNERLAESIHAFALVSTTLSHKELVERYSTKHTVTLEGGEILVDGDAILPASYPRRQEKHNIENLMSAIAMSLGYTSEDRIREVAKSFAGLEHRCESFTFGSIEYINSSIDTTPERTKATLTSLGKPVNIILGGRGKGLPLAPLKEPLIRYAKRISIYGEIRDEMLNWIECDDALSSIPHASFKTFREAIDDADANIDQVKTILLSPAATAYGEFTDFANRGRVFKEYLINKHQKI